MTTNNEKKIRAMIVGGGSAGEMIIRELLSSERVHYEPICVIDDDEQKIGKSIEGIQIVGTTKEIPLFQERYAIEEILIAMPSVDKAEVNRVYAICQSTGVEIKILPGIYQFINGEILSSKLRNVEITDLLGRKQIRVLDSATSSFYRGKVVLITGGGGSIGSELCRQVAKMSPKKIVIVDIYENSAYEIQQELKMAYGTSLAVEVEIVSVTNRAGLDRIFARHLPEIVVMAAAHKHVPLMEKNVVEAVENNVFGTLNTVELAEKYGAYRVLMVSTDKAVNPTSVMGATKRVCEMIVQSHSQIPQKTTFSATRFGNVLGSAGSVIPLFKKQIAAGGPVTITDFRIIRYFMTIPEASQLVLCSGAMAKNGELFVLDMGQPVRIFDLATNLIRLSGHEPEKDIKIVETGLRPGEKLYEELLVKTEELDKTENSLIFIERDKPLPLFELDEKLALLKKGVLDGDDEKMRAILKAVVPTYIEKEIANQQFYVQKK